MLLAICPGSGEPSIDGAPLACWLPVKAGMTPHGLRHGRKTWMAEDGIPEILAEQRLGHQVGMRGLYAHASQWLARRTDRVGLSGQSR
jgi:integrase